MHNMLGLKWAGSAAQYELDLSQRVDGILSSKHRCYDGYDGTTAVVGFDPLRRRRRITTTVVESTTTVVESQRQTRFFQRQVLILIKYIMKRRLFISINSKALNGTLTFLG